MTVRKPQLAKSRCSELGSCLDLVMASTWLLRMSSCSGLLEWQAHTWRSTQLIAQRLLTKLIPKLQNVSQSSRRTLRAANGTLWSR